MKKIFIIFIVSLLCQNCVAQTKLKPGKLSGKYSTFIISEYSLDNINKNIVVYSTSNKYNKGIPRSEAEKAPHFIPMNYRRDIQVNTNVIRPIINAILYNKLDSMKMNKEEMIIIFDFEPNGMLTDVTFGLHANTLITLQEIEEIDRQLRANIKVKFSGKEYLQYTAISYNPPVIVF